MVKRRPLMYKKKCENIFEILRSERTLLMNLYIQQRLKSCINVQC